MPSPFFKNKIHLFYGDGQRFLVAGRDIKAGDVIIDAEEPLIAGPKQATHPVTI